MQLVIVSNGLRVISRGTTDGNAIGLFGADETVRSLCRDELMAEVGGGMEEDAGRGGDPSIGRRRHGPKSRRRHGPKSLDMPHLLSISTFRIVLWASLFWHSS